MLAMKVAAFTGKKTRPKPGFVPNAFRLRLRARRERPRRSGLSAVFATGWPVAAGFAAGAAGAAPSCSRLLGCRLFPPQASWQQAFSSFLAAGFFALSCSRLLGRCLLLGSSFFFAAASSPGFFAAAFLRRGLLRRRFFAGAFFAAFFAGAFFAPSSSPRFLAGPSLLQLFRRSFLCSAITFLLDQVEKHRLALTTCRRKTAIHARKSAQEGRPVR